MFRRSTPRKNTLMKQTCKIKNGEISFDNEGIKIQDNAKKEFRLLIFAYSIWLLYGIISILNFIKGGEQYLLWSGLAISFSYFTMIIILLFRSTKSEIKIDDIKSLKLKQLFGNKYLDIKLVGNKLRRVNKIGLIDYELKEYIETNFKSK